MTLRSLKITTFFLIVVGFNLYGADESVLNGMADKGTFGFVNIITGWVELPMQIKKGYDRSFYIDEGRPAVSRTVGTVWGFSRGVTFTLGRTYMGAYQLAGFWTANPEDNYGIGVPFDGEYAYDKGLFHDIPFNSLHVPISAKFKRGVRNIAGIVLDFPVRIPFVMKKRLYYQPYSKRLWYYPSRVFVGVYETIGCLLPNSEETRGYSFEYKSPSMD